MGILDDAIREHLDLKRKHGAHDADLREIEDEAFGSSDRPDAFAANELFNEVSSPAEGQPAAPEAPQSEPAGMSEIEVPGDLSDLESPGGLSEPGLGEPDVGGEEPTRLVEPEALRPSEPVFEERPSEPLSPPEDVPQIPGQTELPGQDEIPGQESFEDPLEGYRRSTESESEPEPEFEAESEPEFEAPAEPETSEPEVAPELSRPSESLEELIAEEEPFPEDAGAEPAAGPSELPYDPEAPPPPAAEQAAPEVEAAQEPEPTPPPEPESSVPEPPPPPPSAPGTEPPGRARGRVDVPTQEHPPPGQTGGLPPLPPDEPLDEPPSAEETLPEAEPSAEEPPADSGGPALYDFETDEEPLASTPAPADDEDDFEALGPAEEEAPYLEEEEPYTEEPVSGSELAPEEPGTEVRPALEDDEVYEGGDLDPEESYEEEEGEDDLWFEKGPPKDFDFE